MNGKSLRLKPGKDVTITEGPGVAIDGFELDRESTPSTPNTV
jgi:hypothetical protein